MADKWELAVAKLVALTEKGQLKWDQDYRFEDLRPEIAVVSPGFSTVIDGKYVAAYEYRFKQYDDDANWNWETDVRVEFISDTGKLEWQWPGTPSRFRLMDSIRMQFAGAEQFLEHFLAD